MDGEEPGGDPLIGTLLGGRYRVDALIARGGMGRVYRGVQQPLDRPVAIKVLDFHALDPERNQHLEKRFFLEASVCAKLTHPNTLTVHDYGAIEGGRGVYIAMEFLEGRSLRDVIKQTGALGVERTVHIARQICGALLEAHEAGLVHRDLKPGNVVLVHRGADPDFVKVVDFGLVKQVASRDESAEVLTTEGAFLGTPRYMAPEQITGETVDWRADIYALGVVLYECLAGQPPFKSKVRGDVPIDLLTAHIKERPPPLASHPAGRDVPAEIEALVMRCLAKDPKRRFQSMREVLAALDGSAELLEGEPTRVDRASRPIAPASSQPVATPASLSEAIGELAPGEQTTLATLELKPAHGRRTGLWIGASLGGLLALGGGLVVGVVLFGEERGATSESAAAPASSSVTGAPPAAPTGAAPSQAESAEVELHLRSVPEGATVEQSGKRLGVTPLTLTVPRASLADPEARRLTFTLDGHAPESRTLELSAGETLTVEARLTPLEPRPDERSSPPKRRRPKKTRRPSSGAPDLDIKVDR